MTTLCTDSLPPIRNEKKKKKKKKEKEKKRKKKTLGISAIGISYYCI